MKSEEIELRKGGFPNYETALKQALQLQWEMTNKGFMTSSTCNMKPAICQVTVHHQAGTMPVVRANYQPTSLYTHEWLNYDSGEVCAATTYYFAVEE